MINLLQYGKFLVITILIFSLSGCGFHLRKNLIHLGAKYPNMVVPFSGSHTLHQALQRALISSSIRVMDKPVVDTTFPTLRIETQEITQQPLVYGPDSELRRERLKMTISFIFEALPSTPKTFVLMTSRDRQLISSQHLGDNAEKVLIEQEMQADIINQLLYTLQNENF